MNPKRYKQTGPQNPNWKGGDDIKCLHCGKLFHVVPARQKTAKFCSRECKSKWQGENVRGKNHPNWQQDRPSIKYCKLCNREIVQGKTEAISSFRKRKFCSKKCADIGGFRYEGESHPNFKIDSRRKSERGKHGAWARAVISRDNATCQKCGAKNIELHAHHIEPFADNFEKRWDVQNGVALCYKCHWDTHGLDIKNEKDIQDDFVPVDGHRKGKESRRWEGYCKWCGSFISKVWSQRKNRTNHFCSTSCSQKFRMQNLSDETRKKMSMAQKDAAVNFKLERIKSRGHSNSIIQVTRKEKGITQKELADLVGISQGYLSSLENGRERMSEKTSKLMAAILEIDFTILL
jgi:DNA-binding XRE family transcriptional regulator